MQQRWRPIAATYRFVGDCGGVLGSPDRRCGMVKAPLAGLCRSDTGKGAMGDASSCFLAGLSVDAVVALLAAGCGDGLVPFAEKTGSMYATQFDQQAIPGRHGNSNRLPSRGSSGHAPVSSVPGLLAADRPELRRLFASDAREKGERSDDEASPDDDVAGDAAILELALAVLMCLSPRDLKRAKADSAEERELAVDMELRPCSSSPSSLFFRRFSFSPSSCCLRALCSPTSSRLASVQTTSHIVRPGPDRETRPPVESRAARQAHQGGNARDPAAVADP